MKSNEVIPTIISVFALCLIFAASFYLRLVPTIGHVPEFIFDQAFNYRMTQDVVQNGDVPKLDRLSTYPDGKNIKAFLPTGMYHAAALFHKIINRFREVPLNVSILLFCAISGASISIPVYFIAREIYRSRPTAILSALLAGIIPAHLHRSFCYWYRYETAGVPILFVSLLFFIKAFGALEDRRRVVIYAFLSALSLIAALYVWRLSLLFLIVYAIVFLYLFISPRENKNMWPVFITLFGIFLVLWWFIPGLGSNTLATRSESFPKAAYEIIMYKLGLRQRFSEFARLLYYNEELGGIGILKIFSPPFLSLSGLFVVVYIFAFFKDRARDVQKAILLIFLVFFLILTLVFQRNKIILGPLAALTLGESTSYILRERKKSRNMLIYLPFIFIALLVTGYYSWILAVTRYPHNTMMRPYLKQSLAAIRGLAPTDAVILCYWADGYPIQTYCNRATVTDGLFESPELVKRILEHAKANYSYDEGELWNFCKKYGATHILMPFGRKLSDAGYAGLEYKAFFTKRGPTERAKLTSIYKLIYSPRELRRFKYLYRNREFALYKVL